MASSVFRISVLALLAVVGASAAHPKPPSVEPVDAVFENTAPGTIEASFDPPIQGTLRVVVSAAAPGRQAKAHGFVDLPDGGGEPFNVVVTQSGRPIPFRLVPRRGRHKARGAAALLTADIDVNDLTPGVPVRISIHSNLAAVPDLDGHAYAIFR
ncbi:MAG TPA: hypothetical protein VMT38_12345 [Terracidiphilus sp.]|nr:hypothetical protein [Terracidiphilus sp.]